MTTLLQEFEEWLNREYEGSGYEDTLAKALDKLEELKKKHGISKPST